jgi:phosphatidate cytidylyltransferase
VLAPLALALVFYTPLTLFSYFAGAIVLMGAWEWSAFMGLCNKLKRSAFVLSLQLYLCLHFVILPT